MAGSGSFLTDICKFPRLLVFKILTLTLNFTWRLSFHDFVFLAANFPTNKQFSDRLNFNGDNIPSSPLATNPLVGYRTATSSCSSGRSIGSNRAGTWESRDPQSYDQYYRTTLQLIDFTCRSYPIIISVAGYYAINRLAHAVVLLLLQ